MAADPDTARWSRRAALGGAALATSAVLSGGVGAFAMELRDQLERSRLDAAAGRRVPNGGPPATRRVAWSVATSEPVLALTFDDGPDPGLTPLVLEALGRAGVVATFLVVGSRVEAQPDLVRDMVKAGHEVGSHTLTHPDLSRASGAATVHELIGAATIIEATAGVPVRWFRPPWGHLTGAAVRAAAELGQDILLWSTSAHGLGPSREALAEGLVTRVAPGDIIALHDGVCRGRSLPFLSRSTEPQRRRHLEIAALPHILDRAQAAGFRFVTASQLMAAEP